MAHDQSHPDSPGTHDNGPHEHGAHEHGAAPHSAREWDERYNSADRLWTALVNPSLIDEAGALPPGTALDVGSGEGADARWLAGRGWQVTAVDISRVAIDRAAQVDSPSDSGDRHEIRWLHTDLTVDEVPGGFTLVSAHYFPIPLADRAVADKLVAAVAPGGTLLVVAHDESGIRAHGIDPGDYVQPADYAALLDDSWTIVTDETRPRARPAGSPASGQRHMLDVILRAQRRP